MSNATKHPADIRHLALDMDGTIYSGGTLFPWTRPFLNRMTELGIGYMGEQDGKVVLKNMGAMNPRKISGHTSSPTVVDWDQNGIPDLLVGSEDGHLYFMENPRTGK